MPKGKIDVGSPRAKFCRKRLVSPKKCDPSSFRIKEIKGRPDVKRTICCPKGSYDRKKKRCKVGTITQSVMRRKKKGRCPRF